MQGALPAPSGTVRFALFMTVMAAAAGVLAFGTMHVPVRMAILPAHRREDYAWLSITAVAFVFTVAGSWVAALLWRMRRTRVALRSPASSQAQDEASPGPDQPLRRWAPLAVLRPELVPAQLIVLTALIALATVVAATLMAWPPWAVISAGLIPWIPLLFVEGIRKYRHYGLYAVFGAITLLQIGHMGEHSVQVGQVFMTGGDLSRSHGVFGQLDFETVHFTWDTTVWIGLGVLLTRFGSTNRWLWLSFAAAGLHEIEHIYLFTVFKTDPAFYMNGGLAGIMGLGGVVGSPLARPYLHFAYNVCVIVPLVFAFWDQTVRVYGNERQAAARAVPHRPPLPAPA
jgi:hypothetical protein